MAKDAGLVWGPGPTWCFLFYIICQDIEWTGCILSQKCFAAYGFNVFPHDVHPVLKNFDTKLCNSCRTLLWSAGLRKEGCGVCFDYFVPCKSKHNINHVALVIVRPVHGYTSKSIHNGQNCLPRTHNFWQWCIQHISSSWQWCLSLLFWTWFTNFFIDRGKNLWAWPETSWPKAWQLK